MGKSSQQIAARTSDRRSRSLGGIDFRHPVAFWAGVGAVCVGVLAHLPMYLASAGMHYRMVGMSPDAPMLIGMAVIVVGLAAVGYGLVGRPPESATQRTQTQRLTIRSLDDARLRPSHVALILVMSIAVTIDASKPITLGFVIPGMAKEYGLGSALKPSGALPVALLPLFGLGGTLIGSLTWGRLGDLIGRRASILLAGVLFIATSICGAMPSYEWNFAMCFIMGIGVGGMLPITLTLIAELLPRRHRGWAMVMIGGELALAYVMTSVLASALIPTYGWRILWLLGLPTGATLIALQRFIPESPRFLLLRNRTDEAMVVMRRYGARVVQSDPSEATPASTASGHRATGLPRHRRSMAIVLLALGAGLVTYGFQLWIPTNLQKLGFTEVTSAGFLRDSALIGLPVTAVVALLYAFWSARGTILLLALTTIAALLGFVAGGDGVVNHRLLLQVLLTAPIAIINSLLAAVLAYTVETYPTTIRSTATGFAAGVSKTGGVALTALVAAAIAPPSIRNTALLGVIPLVLGTAAILIVRVETSGRSLEDISASPSTADGIASRAIP